MTIFTILTYAMLILIVGAAASTAAHELGFRSQSVMPRRLVPSRRPARSRA